MFLPMSNNCSENARCTKNKINRAKVLAALNTICPKCGYSISPAQIMRIDFDRMRCPECGAVFAAKAEPARKTD
jgi:ribosomal protein S27AE